MPTSAEKRGRKGKFSASDMQGYVTQQEFTAFRDDVSDNFNRLFRKVEGITGQIAESRRPQWSPIVALMAIIVSVGSLAMAGYITHVSDGHPRLVSVQIESLAREAKIQSESVRREAMLRDEITRLGGRAYDIK